MEKTIKKILVANRGLSAMRIMHACRDRKIPSIAVFSAPDRLSYHVHLADRAVPIGPGEPDSPYLDQSIIIEAALTSGADAIHPGWGPLSEDADFAQKVLDAGLTWIGTRPEAIRLARDPAEAGKVAAQVGIPVAPPLEGGRHVKVQILADRSGHAVHLFERECTLRYADQKIIEEAPSPSLDQDLRLEMCAAAVRFMLQIGCDSAGTVEFLLDPAAKKFYFHEVHPRLQDEHGLTELVTGLDIAGLMLDVAQGRELPFEQSEVQFCRRALGARLLARDPKTFAPSSGRVTRLTIPMGPNVRFASGISEGSEVRPDDGPLLMLLMTSGSDRPEAVRVMERALRDLRVEGVQTLAPLLLSIVRHPAFIRGFFSDRFIEEHMEELVSMMKGGDTEDEALKIARYVAEATVLGPAKWV